MFYYTVLVPCATGDTVAYILYYALFAVLVAKAISCLRDDTRLVIELVENCVIVFFDKCTMYAAVHRSQ